MKVLWKISQIREHLTLLRGTLSASVESLLQSLFNSGLKFDCSLLLPLTL